MSELIPVMIVPVLTRYDLLDRMITSINYPVKDLIIIDNGAKQNDWSPTWNQWVSKIWHLKMPNNMGVAGSWNLGIKSTPFSEWWLIVNFDTQWPEKSLKMFYDESEKDRIILSTQGWCAFSIGWKVIQQVGLFEENLFPAYFEDNDYERRAELKNIEIKDSFIPIEHDNSSTIRQGGFMSQNDITFPRNYEYFKNKVQNNINQELPYDLKIRRMNEWE
jgi:GT2 family glycosyltransferase